MNKLLLTILASFFIFSQINTINAQTNITQLSFVMFLHGIGKGGDNSNRQSTGNLDPITKTRPFIVEIYNNNNTLISTFTTNLQYLQASGVYSGSLQAANLTTGDYTVRVYTPKYLKRQLNGIIHVNANQNNTVAPAALIVGDSTDDNRLDILDYNQLVDCFSELTPARNCNDANKKFMADLTDDNKVNQNDYNLFLRELSVQSGDIDPTPGGVLPTLNPNQPSATRTPSNNPTLTNAPSNSPTNVPVPTIGVTTGVWISKEEIMKLPTSGAAWEKVNNAANSSWGSACLNDNNCMHDVNTLAGALVAARTDNATMRNKTIQGLQSATNSTLDRALELSRGLQTYIIAADIIGYKDAAFQSWVREMITKNIQGHSGTGVLGTATNSPNNWGGHARASLAAAAIYLNDSNYKNEVVAAHKAFIGIAPSNKMVYESTTWHADSANKAGVNRKGAVISGKNVSGVLPEDWRRGDYNFTWPPKVSGYMWEGMQGYVVTSVILHRAGLVPFNSGDNAVVRSMNMLYGTGEAANNSLVFKNTPSGDDTWIPWVVNFYGGSNFPTTSTSPGKNMGWTDWTHAK